MHNQPSKEDHECLMKELHNLIALVDTARQQTEFLEESLSRAKEEAKIVPERRSKRRSQ